METIEEQIYSAEVEQHHVLRAAFDQFGLANEFATASSALRREVTDMLPVRQQDEMRGIQLAIDEMKQRYRTATS